MNRKVDFLQTFSRTQIFSIIATLCVFLAYILTRITGVSEHTAGIQVCMMAVLLGCCLYILLRKPEESVLCTVIIIMGIVMRIGYMLYTGCQERQHDIWELDKNGYGHAAYLLTLIQDGYLPERMDGQMYQQPMFYILGATASRIINGILSSQNAKDLVDAAKTVSCSASCISLIISRDIFEICNLRGKETRFALMLTAFLPAFYIAGGTISPDALACMFMLLSFDLTLKWMKCTNWSNTILLAIVYGFAVSTKISCGLIALMTAVVFVWKFISVLKRETKKDVGTLIFKYMVFGMISLPLGLWYGVRNYTLFGQPLNYVMRLPEDSPLYRGSYSIVKRLFVVPISYFFQSPYTDVDADYNAPAYYIKSALFNEYQYSVPGWIPVLLLFSAMICAVACLVALVWQIWRNRRDFYGNITAVMCILYYGSMLMFYLQYPFSCSMDFRYMLFLPVLFAILLGKYLQFHSASWGWIKTGLYGLSVMSCVMYLLV